MIFESSDKRVKRKNVTVVQTKAIFGYPIHTIIFFMTNMVEFHEPIFLSKLSDSGN